MLYFKRTLVYSVALFAFFIITSCLAFAWLNNAHAKAYTKAYNSDAVSFSDKDADMNGYYPTACGTTKTVNLCATSTTLTADAYQSNYTWNTGAITRSITVTRSGQYWWETTDKTNTKVTNGTFSIGNTGFTSAYTYADATNDSGALYPEATYTITTSPKNAHPNFGDFGDHTNGRGNMMVVNGAPTPDVTIWSQSINVTQNTDYIFSVWFTSVYTDNPGKLNFSINGDALGDPIELTPNVGVWKNFTVRWNSGTNTSATIGIVNQNTSAAGNDFALDDLSFYPVCRNYFDVTLRSNPPKPTITPF
jgi:hypothetical protein